jgi:Na+-transporting NADH:ubiquinone oxidoreductase subunit NqrB
MARLDPRTYQLAVPAGLLTAGLTTLHFDLDGWQVAVTIGTALAAQATCARLARLPRLNLQSALISGLSLSLLLRTSDLRWAFAAAAMAITSKFLVRWRGKHVFNPTNFAIVALLLVTPAVWVSPGEWGATAFTGFLLGCLGTIVSTRAARADVTFTFLGSHALLLFGRALWLGDPLAIPLYRLENGALLLFAFFMISDPKTTPDSRAGRVLFGCLVAAGAYYVDLVLYRTNGILWALAAAAPLVPVLDAYLPGPRYAWPPHRSPTEETSHEALAPAPAPGHARGGVLVH